MDRHRGKTRPDQSPLRYQRTFISIYNMVSIRHSPSACHPLTSRFSVIEVQGRLLREFLRGPKSLNGPLAQGIY